MSTEQLIHLDPAHVLADDNIRFAMSPSDIAQMEQDIIALGYISTPVEVEEIEEGTPASNGCTHRLTTGFRRWSAAMNLNKTQNAGLTLPAIVRSTNGDPVLRLKHQVSENKDRKDFSPMDTASAIKRLMDSGVSRVEIRDLFRRPSQKKGHETQPASNAWVNMMLGFLQLPKSVQADIHSGLVGTAAGYELTKCSPEKRADIIERAKEKRQAELEKEANEEKKYLDAESKVSELAKEEETLTTELDHAQAEADLASVNLKNKSDASVMAYKAAKAAKGDARKEAQEHHKAAEADLKGAEKRHAEAVKALEKLSEKKISVSSKVEDMRARLTEARKAAPKAKEGRGKGKAVGAGDIKAAAKEAGDDTGNTKLNAAQMRKTIEDLTLAGTYEKVALIGAAIKACFDGEISAGTMLKRLAKVTGETSKTMPTAPDVKQGPAKKA